MANDKTQNRKPTHDVLHVKGEGKSAFWTKIGAAWTHEDQAGLNVALDFMPVTTDGRLVIRIRKEKTEIHGDGALSSPKIMCQFLLEFLALAVSFRELDVGGYDCTA